MSKEKSKIEIIIGKRGLGKTTLLKKKIFFLLPFEPRANIIIFDTLFEYDTDDFFNFDSFIIIESIADFRKQINDFIENRMPIRIIFKPIGIDGFKEETFDQLCFFINILSNIHFFVDEADSFCNAYYVSENFRKIIEYGRHKNISLYCSARRFTALSRYLTSQANKLITFRQSEPRDLKLMSEFGMDINAVKKLPDYVIIEKEI